MQTPKLKTDGPAWQAAEEFGVDMAQLEANLMKTPWERIQQHSRALNTAILLREAMEKKREATRTDSGTPDSK
jgi:hypothetical protein